MAKMFMFSLLIRIQSSGKVHCHLGIGDGELAALVEEENLI